METISIRSIQHYLYCPHRWGLIEIDKAWAENYFVIKANLMHDRVHSGETYTIRGRKVYTDVDVWNDELGLYGKPDCIEDRNGSLCIVEYKPTKPVGYDYHTEDAMQIFAQKLCVDSVFGGSCKAEIYYSDVRKRFSLPFDEQYSAYMQSLLQILGEMRAYMESGVIPQIRKSQNCSGCSMKDMCMPSAVKRKRKSIRDLVQLEWEEFSCESF